MKGVIRRLASNSLLIRESLCTNPFIRLGRFTHTSSREEINKKRNELFSAEKKRQQENVGRIEKIEVRYMGVPEDKTLVMNKEISTPYHCAQHLSEMLIQRSALALIDDIHLWDMHRPIQSSCSLKLLHFKEAEPHHVNKAFWRTCSFILGGIIENSFKDNIHLALHSFPSPNVKSGSFTYDVELHLEHWKPSHDELRIITGQMVEFCQKGHAVERLVVNADLALDMFIDNEHKTRQIPDIASHSPSGDEITLYRIGGHIDISKGPLIGNSSLIGRCAIAAVHQVQSANGSLYRFQGVALPRGFLLNHYAFSILVKRAQNLNSTRSPAFSTGSPEEAVAI